jgi:hypothetical protein
LLYLEHNGLITIEKTGGFKRCFVKGQVGVEEKQLICIIRQQPLLEIISYLLKHPNARHKDICQGLKLRTPWLSYHLKKLVKQHVVMLDSENDKKVYRLCDPKKISILLIKYKPTGISKRIQDTWLEFKP